MRKLLVTAAAIFSAATMASAADLPAKAPAAAPAVFNWTGCYVGAAGGENWGKSSQVARSSRNAGLPITGDFRVSGGIAGGTVGCNLEVSNFVFGVETDFSWTNARGSAPDQPPFAVATTSASREKWLETVRGRVGYAWDRFMVYGTAGLATAKIGVDVSNPAFATVSDSQTRSGWTAGAGGEWAAWTAPWGGLTFKVEYLHDDFSSGGQFVNPPVLTAVGSTVVTRDVRLTNDMVRVGMNLLFSFGSAAPAK